MAEKHAPCDRCDACLEQQRRDMQRHQAASHAVQTGVATEIARGVGRNTEPKHLRVGINVAMCEHAAVVRLLVSKGVVTNTEYFTAIADEMEAEKKRYEDRLTEMLGRKVVLV